MAIIKERKEYFNANDELIDVIYVILEDDGSKHKIGVGTDNLFKTEAEQIEIVKNIHINSKLREVVTTLNESF
jgi:hypothetical protein